MDHLYLEIMYLDLAILQVHDSYLLCIPNNEVKYRLITDCRSHYPNYVIYNYVNVL